MTADTAHVLDTQPTKYRPSLLASMREARRLAGKSALSQCREMWRLLLGPGRVEPDEYFYFGLYDDRRYSAEDKARFVGTRVQSDVLLRCTDMTWWAIAHDKIAFYAFMQSYGFPVPRVEATLHPYRRLAGSRNLRTVDELAAYLREPAPFPLFAKPFDGMRSVGSSRVDGYDPASDELVLYGGRRVPVGVFVDAVAAYRDSGYLFQRVAHPHPDVRAICGDRLATIRLVVLFGPSGPEVFRAAWKIPAGEHIADNFWRRGNLLAGIDLATGRVTRAFTGVGTARRDVERHPDSSVPLVGLTVPDWEATKATCLAAAATMPGITIQGWDVAATDSGPMLIEVNIGGDFTLPQLGHDEGLLDERFRAYLASHQFRPRSAVKQARTLMAGVGRRLRSAILR